MKKATKVLTPQMAQVPNDDLIVAACKEWVYYIAKGVGSEEALKAVKAILFPATTKGR